MTISQPQEGLGKCMLSSQQVAKGLVVSKNQKETSKASEESVL